MPRGRPMREPRTDLGAEIRRLRKESGMTQRQLGDAIGVTHPAVSTLESGLRTPGLGTLRRLAAVLGVRPSDILRGAGE